MGIYTQNRYFGEAYDYASEIPANEAYGTSLGCAQILVDCQKNDMALFEAAIYSDIAEVRSIQEGYGYVNENAFTDVIKRIIEMFKKLLGKIKGIFKAFLAKITGTFKNGKDLVKQYEKQIIKYANWKDFKCKGIRVPKNDSLRSTIDTLFQANKISAVNYTIATVGEADLNTGLEGYDTVKKIDDADGEDIKNAIVKKYVPAAKVSDIKDIHEDIMDYLFDSEETLDGDDQVKSASYFSKEWIKTILSDGEKWEKDIKKFNDKLEKNINNIIDNLNKDDNELAKFMANKDNKDKLDNIKYTKSYNKAGTDNKVEKQSAGDFSTKGDSFLMPVGNTMISGTTGAKAESIQKAIHALQKLATNEQEVITKVTSEYLTVVKFSLAQARKIWTAAAAWSSGVHKESVEYAQAVGDVAADQLYSVMESIH